MKHSMLAGLSILMLSMVALPVIAIESSVDKVQQGTITKQSEPQETRERQQLIEELDSMFEQERQEIMADLNQRLEQMHQEMIKMVDERFRQAQEQRLNR